MLEGGDDESADEEISDVDEDEVEGENITILYTPSHRSFNLTQCPYPTSTSPIHLRPPKFSNLVRNHSLTLVQMYLLQKCLLQ